MQVGDNDAMKLLIEQHVSYHIYIVHVHFSYYLIVLNFFIGLNFPEKTYGDAGC